MARRTGVHAHLSSLTAAARASGPQIVIVPHHRWSPGERDGWRHPNPYLSAGCQGQVFAAGSWAGEWYPPLTPVAGDLIGTEHWGSSGCANTNLNSLLKQRGIPQRILVGLIANTRIESTGTYAVELGYQLSLARDATAAASDEAMRCAHDVHGPTDAHHIVTTAEVLAALEPYCG